MMLHRYFIQDLNIWETEKFRPNSGIEIYEVVRVEEGIPVFLEEHLSRFYHSAWLCHLEIPIDGHTIRLLLKQLVEANGVLEGNVRFSYCFRPTGIFQAYFIPHWWPDEKVREEGVSCGMLLAERADPNAKVVQQSLRETANRMMASGGFYEVLLVNRNGYITEGSRSNAFILRDGIFHTAPPEEVLSGITRQKVMELIRASRFSLTEKSYPAAELEKADGLFLTGTSPKVLPVRCVEPFHFRVDHPEISRLMAEYDLMVKEYIQRNKW